MRCYILTQAVCLPGRVSGLILCFLSESEAVSLSLSTQGCVCLLHLEPWQTPGYSVLQAVLTLQLIIILLE